MFSFFISLLSKIYRNKTFCESLLEKFYTMNSQPKGKEQEKKEDQDKGKEQDKEKGK